MNLFKYHYISYGNNYFGGIIEIFSHTWGFQLELVGSRRISGGWYYALEIRLIFIKIRIVWHGF